MITKEQQKNLIRFFEIIDKVSHQGLYDLGLVVKSKKQKIEDLIKFAPKDRKIETLRFNNKLIADDLLKFIIRIFKQKKWGIIELENGFLPHKAYSQLRFLSTINRLQVDLMGGEKQIILKQPKESRAIVVVNEESLSEIKIPTFLRVFGPIINLK